MSQVHADLVSLPPDVRPYIRYLVLPENEYELDNIAAAYAVVSGHVNHLSTTSIPVTPLAVKNTAGRLMRLDIRSYNWDSKVYERLYNTDPDYHVEVIAPWGGGIWHGDNYQYAANQFEFKTRAFIPELIEQPEDRAKLTDIVTWTYSGVPFLKANWFFNQTAIQQDRVAGYYEWLGIKDKKTFEELVGFDAKRNRRKIEMREAVATSGVTRQPRGITRFDADEGGAYWYSIDFKLATGEKNPLAIFGRDIEKKPDGFETFGRLPNGFWATGAFNGAGVRVDFAPSDLATDHQSKSNDHSVHPNASCMRCHNNAGMKSFTGWAKNIATPPLDIYDPDYDNAFLTRQQYLRDLEKAMERDRELFSEAVLQATGMQAKDYLEAYAEFWESYEDAQVGVELAAKKLYTTKEEFLPLMRSALNPAKGPPVIYVSVYPLYGRYYVAEYNSEAKGYVNLQKNVDRVLSVLTLEGPRAQRIPIRQWEEASPLARYYVHRTKGEKR